MGKRIEAKPGDALRAWMKSNDWNQVDFAAELSTHQTSVSSWLTGRQRPEHHLRIAIERMTGICALDWMTPKERVIAFGKRAA